jgi:hypothetical protein
MQRPGDAGGEYRDVTNSVTDETPKQPRAHRGSDHDA